MVSDGHAKRASTPEARFPRATCSDIFIAILAEDPDGCDACSDYPADDSGRQHLAQVCVYCTVHPDSRLPHNWVRFLSLGGSARV